MFKPLRLIVLTPAKTLLDVSDVQWVNVQLADGGGIGILPGHAPLLAETVSAPLKYADELGEHSLQVGAGILQIVPGRVIIYTTESDDVDTVGARLDNDAREERLTRLAEALLQALQTKVNSTMEHGHVEEG